MLKSLMDRALLAAVRHSHSVAQRVTLSVPARVEGNPLKVPVIQGIGFQNLRVWPKDRALYRVVRQLFQRTEGAMIDVGCNIGHFMELCILADRRRRYAGFDASLSCCQYVERFIRENRLPAHRVFPIALSDRPGVRSLYSNGDYDVCASLSPEVHPAGALATGGTVLTERGDVVIDRLDIDSIACIKIDVEGLEVEVLRGLDGTIARHRPAVIVEVLIYAHLAAGGTDQFELQSVAAERKERAIAIERFFRERDYVVYKMQRQGDLEYRETVDPGDSTDNIAMDHLALPREKARDLLSDYPCRIDSGPLPVAAL